MPVTQVLKAKGRFTFPNDLSEVPQGAFAEANNVTVDREGIVEPIRGLKTMAGTLGASNNRAQVITDYQDTPIALGSDGHLYRRNSSAWTQVDDGTVTLGRRFAKMHGNLFNMGVDGLLETDGVSTAPIRAGVPRGLDLESALRGTSGFFAGDGQVGYRLTFGRRDANRRVIEGAPSMREVIASPSLSYATANVSRSAGTTITFDNVTHGLTTGQSIVIGPGERYFPAGTYTVTVSDSNTFTITAADGDNPASSTNPTKTTEVWAASSNVRLTITIPETVTSGVHFYRIYRTAQSGTDDEDPGDDCGLIFEGALPANLTTTGFTKALGIVTVTTSTDHGLAAGQVVGILGSGGTGDYLSGSYVVASTPTSTTFTYDTGDGMNASALVASQTVRVVTFFFDDIYGDDLRGASLYTNQAQGGIAQANTIAPVADEMVEFNGMLFFGKTTGLYRTTFTLLSVNQSTDSSVDSGDSIILGSASHQVYAAGSSEVYTSQTFKLYTSSDAAQNIERTAKSLCRTINRNYYNSEINYYAYYISGPNDPPGTILLEERRPGAASSIFITSASCPNAWLPPIPTSGNTVAPVRDAFDNAVAWTQKLLPESVPLGNYQRLGDPDADVLRLFVCGTSLWCFKADGLWRITGDSPRTLRFDLFDRTVRLIAKETVASLGGSVFALTSQGVVRIDDSTPAVTSRAIESDLKEWLASNFGSVHTFAISYESEHKYMLWLRDSDEVDYAVHVYNSFTDTWSTRDDDRTCAFVSPVDDKLYAGNPSANTIAEERKDLLYTDFAGEELSGTISAHSGATVTLSDASSVEEGDVIEQSGVWSVVTGKNGNILTLDDSGLSWSNAACTIQKAIECSIKWAPFTAGSPGTLKMNQEVGFLFREGEFLEAEAVFTSELSSSEQGSTLSGDLSGAREVRVLVPLEKRICSRLSAKLTVRQAWKRWQVAGIAYAWVAGQSAKVAR